jgi:hypothetical protein
MKTKDNLLQEKEVARKIASLKEHEGWPLLMQHFDAVLQQIKLNLLTVNRMEDLIRYQEKFRAFSAMLDAANNYEQLHVKVLQELQDRAEQEHFNKTYNLGD